MSGITKPILVEGPLAARQGRGQAGDGPGRRRRPKPHRMLVGFPPELFETLQQRAEDNVRSINGEVIHLIKFALAKLPKPSSEEDVT